MSPTMLTDSRYFIAESLFSVIAEAEKTALNAEP